MTDVLLLNGPCDPRRVTMVVTTDATEIHVRPEPFGCHDVYILVDRRTARDMVTEATAEYLHTVGPQPQIHAYRKRIARFGTGRAFKVKRGRSAD
jgi:hypothetical protein